MGQQILGGKLQLTAVLGEDVLTAAVGGVHNGLDLLVDEAGDFLGVAAGLGHSAANEDLVALAGVGDGAQLLAHAVLGDHVPGDGGGLLDVARGASGDIPQHQLLGHPAA